jgi:DNA primase
LIPSEIIEEIKFRNDIVDVISGYVTLKRSGSGFVGLCPFHSERTPSFHIVPERGFFYCFGCGAGGDVIWFIRKIENLDYAGAVELLAKRAGITLPERAGDKQAEHSVKKTRILEINREAARFFHAQLLASPAALDYLSRRGLAMPTIKHFGLGYAPDKFDAVQNHMTGLGFTVEELTAAFICGISSKTGKPFDYFRGRIMFPIIDVGGDVIAFGGRSLGDAMPKYLNTSDTPAFKKSRSLFALNFARHNCAERLILCEGYMDVIALHAAGFTNAVATLGTALTDEQARLMKRYTKQVIITYDSDEAGQNAADKAFRVLGAAGLDTKILTVTGAKDPDEFIKKYGAAAFKKLLDGSRSRFEFKLDEIIAKYKIGAGGETDDDNRLKAINETVALLSEIYSKTECEICCRRAAERLAISAENLERDVEARRRKYLKIAKRDRRRETLRVTEGYGDRVNPDKLRFRQEAAAEEVILGILLLYPELTGDALKLIGPDGFRTQLNRRIYEAIVEAGTGFSLSALGQKLTEAEMSRAVSYMAARQHLTKNDLEVIEGCAKTLLESAAPFIEDGASRTDAPPDPDEIAALIARRKSGERDS